MKFYLPVTFTLWNTNTWAALRIKTSIANDSLEHSYRTKIRIQWNRSIMPTVFSHACLLFFASCITPKRFRGVFPFHSPLFVKGSYFKWNLALISLTSSLSPLPFSFDCYSRKKKECNPCLFTECVQSLNSLVLPSIQTLLRRAHPHRDSSISLFASAFSSSHAAGCYCI